MACPASSTPPPTTAPIIFPQIRYFSHADPQIGDIDPLLSFGSKNEKT
jgi:hypothetical protein